MGMDATATLFYGYCWDEEGDLFEDDADWEDVLANKSGLVNPWDSAPEYCTRTYVRAVDGSYDEYKAKGEAWTTEHRPELDTWYDAKRELVKAVPVEIGWHGSHEYSVPYLYVKGARRLAEWGERVAIDPLFLQTGPFVEEKWNVQLADFIEGLGIDVSGAEGPGWFLVASYG